MDALDVWLKFDDDGDECPSHEANTYPDGDRFRVEWYHVDVGLVTDVYFDTLEAAHEWLDVAGYSDFTA